jgi:hypothetical protein
VATHKEELSLHSSGREWICGDGGGLRIDLDILSIRDG